MKKTTVFFLLVGVLFSLMLPMTTQAQAATAPGEAWDSDGDGTLSVLSIGNSFSEDILAYVWNIAVDLGISDVVLGNLSAEDGALSDHWFNAKADQAAYTYYMNNDGSWTATDGYKLSEALSSRSWDFVTLQQLSDDSGKEETYNADLTNLAAYVKTLAPQAQLVWNVTWAYGEGSEKLAASAYADQLEMHNNTLSATINTIANNKDFAKIVPLSSAVQNIRTSLIGESVAAADGIHLDIGIGRYLAGLTFVQAITGLDIWESNWTPENVPYAWQVIAMESAGNAISQPFAITPSEHDNPETSYLYDVGVDTKSESNPYNDVNYARMLPDWTKSGYWQSNSEDSPTKIITNKSNSPNFWCTRQYSTSTLPVGSVIILASGYKYRPDAWKSDAKQSGRPDEVTAAGYTVVDSKWWGSYTKRAFNISKSDGSDISGLSESTINSAFKIYFPVSKAQGSLTDTNKFVRLRITLTKNAYWYSTSKDYWSEKVTTEPNCSQFFCTEQFTKSQLPVGSVICCNSAWEFRPECWNGDAIWSGERPHILDEVYMRIANAQYVSRTKHAFNVRRDDQASIASYTDAQMQDVFRIYIPKSGHTHSYNVSTKDSTCSATGTKTSTCKTCYYSFTETIAKKAHTEATSAAKAATCTETGLTQGKYCSVCKEVITAQNIVDALGHDEVVDAAVAATCTETGLTEGSHCSRCPAVILAQEIIPAAGHTEATDAAVDPTCTEDGITEGKHCSVCSVVLQEQEIIPAKGHNYDDGVITSDPSCTEEGITTITCLDCGASYTEAAAAYGHTVITDPAVAPSCTENGLTEGSHCEECGEVLVAQEEVTALGHNYIITVVDPTCAYRGCTVYSCFCGYYYTTDYVPAKGHSYVAVTTDATCTENGAIVYTCSDCGNSYTDVIPAKGHSYVAVTTDATCTEDGSIVYNCSDCGNSYTDVIPATGHIDITTSVTDASCTEAGSVVVTCACGEVVSTETVAALGHSYVYTNNGDDHIVTCANGCDYTVTQAHSYVDALCICGAEEIVAPAEPIIDKNISVGEQLFLESDLTMNFRIKENQLTAYDTSSAYLVVERDIYATDGTTAVDVQTITDFTVKDNRLVFIYSGIAASQMNDEIRVTFFIKGKDGKDYQSTEKITSITTYAKTLLETMPTGYDKLYAVLMDMLNYGSAAQAYFKRHADAPANQAYAIFDDYAQYASSQLNQPLESLSSQLPNEGAAATITQALDLGTRIGITYKVTLPAGVDAANAQLIVKDENGNELETIDLSTGTIDNKGRYVVNFYGNASRQMRRVVYATVCVDGKPISNTYTYSISTYAYEVANTAGMPANLITLTELMVVYGDSATVYFN